jgi:hypothetical protein
MQNPIPQSGLWVTPSNVDELYTMVEQYSGEQKALAMHIMMLTLNTCHNLVEQQHVAEGV